MKILKFIITILIGIFSFVFTDTSSKKLTVEWINTDEAEAIAQVYKYHWLEDNTAILYDLRMPRSERTFLRLNPE